MCDTGDKLTCEEVIKITETIMQAIPAMISGVSLVVVAWIARKVSGLIRRFGTLEESQRNQLKADIAELYERSGERGYITPMELDSANRMADSYFALGGNHYIHAVLHRMNENMKIKGEAIPQ